MSSSLTRGAVLELDFLNQEYVYRILKPKPKQVLTKEM